MVTVEPDGNDFVFEISAVPPLIYLDHWALRRFSSNTALKKRFLEIFRSRGTLMMSLMNAVEIPSSRGGSLTDRRHSLK
jgi:hypothetical protein